MKLLILAMMLMSCSSEEWAAIYRQHQADLRGEPMAQICPSGICGHRYSSKTENGQIILFEDGKQFAIIHQR